MHMDAVDAVHACALRVYEALGTGRRENVYQAALAIELGSVGQHLRAEVSHPITYRGQHVGIQRLDLESETYFIELKAVSRLLPAHAAQTCAYVRDRQKPGVLINFGASFEIQFFDYGGDMPIQLTHKIMSTMTTTFPITRNNLLTTDVKVKIVKDRYGDEIVAKPKIGIEAGDKFYNTYLCTVAHPVLYSTLGETGDMEKWNKPEEQARFNFTLRQGVPSDRVKAVLPNLANEQVQEFDLIKQYHKMLVGAAFDSDEVKCTFKEKFKKAAKKKLKGSSQAEILALAREMYIENSSNCGIKIREWKDPNGEEVEGEVLVVKRRIVGMRNGEKTSLKPVFHKINHEGDYHEVQYEDYVPRDTLLKMRVRPQFFSAPLMYGTSCWFDKDIIVLWRPKRTEAKKETAAVPVFEDGDDEPPAKRARNE